MGFDHPSTGLLSSARHVTVSCPVPVARAIAQVLVASPDWRGRVAVVDEVAVDRRTPLRHWPERLFCFLGLFLVVLRPPRCAWARVEASPCVVGARGAASVGRGVMEDGRLP